MLKVEGRKPHGERTKMLETKDPRLDGNISFGEKKEEEESFLQSLKGRTRMQVDPNDCQMLRAFSVG